MTWALLVLFLSNYDHFSPLPSISATSSRVRGTLRDVAMTVCPPTCAIPVSKMPKAEELPVISFWHGIRDCWVWTDDLDESRPFDESHTKPLSFRLKYLNILLFPSTIMCGQDVRRDFYSTIRHTISDLASRFQTRQSLVSTCCRTA